ncbi:MAG TPA: RDD family protein [Frankiaceae bacterium]|nr:RDD family protein [Frankiaceae bacterium]
MGRAVGSWLEGPRLPRDQPPGVRLGLPADGPGSAVGFGPRLGAFVVDGIVANLIAGIPYLVGARYSPGTRGLVVYAAFLLQELVLITATGQTFGMRLTGLRVIRVSDRGLQRLRWVLARTVLLGLLVPALIWDRDRRGVHDKAPGTVVVRDPQPRAGASPATAADHPPSGGVSRPRPARRRPGRVRAAGVGADHSRQVRPPVVRPPADQVSGSCHRGGRCGGAVPSGPAGSVHPRPAAGARPRRCRGP